MRSILSQTLRDIEVICIDDGSTDGSFDRLKEYAAQDARVKVLSQPNSGAAVARNSGLGHANGEFVAFMDPDDLYPNAEVLSTLYSRAVENGVDACGGCMMQFFPDGRKIEHYSGLNFGYEFTTEGIVDYLDYQFENQKQ
jgi:glycosyltransferase involved in cell wall biosynthesis